MALEDEIERAALATATYRTRDDVARDSRLTAHGTAQTHSRVQCRDTRVATMVSTHDSLNRVVVDTGLSRLHALFPLVRLR